LSIYDNSPAGRYPIAFAFSLIPALIGSAMFWVVVYFILRLIGFRVFKNSDDDKAA